MVSSSEAGEPVQRCVFEERVDAKRRIRLRGHRLYRAGLNTLVNYIRHEIRAMRGLLMTPKLQTTSVETGERDDFGCPAHPAPTDYTQCAHARFRCERLSVVFTCWHPAVGGAQTKGARGVSVSVVCRPAVMCATITRASFHETEHFAVRSDGRNNPHEW